MPSREPYRIVRGVLVWFAWFLFTLDPRHGRTYGQLRRLTPTEIALQFVPITLVVGVALWFHFLFPDRLVVWAASGWVAGLFLGGTLVLWMVAGAKLSDWYLLRLGRRRPRRK